MWESRVSAGCRVFDGPFASVQSFASMQEGPYEVAGTFRKAQKGYASRDDEGGGIVDCTQNNFCRSLDDDLRSDLCAHCTKRFYAKGQLVYRSDIASRITLVADGVLTTQSTFYEGTLGEDDCPSFFILTNGLLIGVDFLFRETAIKRYEYIHYICLQDTTLAMFDRAYIRDLFESDIRFARAMYENIVVAAGEACEFAAVLRAPDVYQSVSYLLNYATRKNFQITQQQMADITGHSRVSVTRAIARIKAERPELWHRYLAGHEEL